MSKPPLTLSGWLRLDVVERVLRGVDGCHSVLEVGAGEGAVGARLAVRYRYTGLEPDPAACTTARSRVEPAGGTVLCGGLDALESQASFDLVCAFEVLEHVEDDRAELLAWSELVRAGGWLMLTVPPFERRFGRADQAVGHFRRYDPDRLVELVRAAGFARPRAILYGFPFGHGLEGARNLLAWVAPSRGSMAERSAASGRRFQPNDRLGLLTQVVAVPMRLAQRPFVGRRLGSNLLVLAQKL